MYQQYGLGQLPPGAHCPSFDQRLRDVTYLLDRISYADKLAWIAAAKAVGQGSWEPLIWAGDAPAIASNLVGNADCQNVRSGQQIAEWTFRLIEKYQESGDDCEWNATTGVYDCPGIDVDVPGGGGGGGGGGEEEPRDWLPWILGGFGVVMLLAGDRKRARRR